MAVIRVKKVKNYTAMTNYHLQNKNMSLKAKGLLSVILSLPDDWDYTIEGLCGLSKDNETSVKSALKELKEFGFLEINKITPDQTKSGRFEYQYTIYEKPKQASEKQEVEILGLEKQGVEILAVENQGQLNTNKQSTNKQSTNNKNNIRAYAELIDEYTYDERLRESLKGWVEMRRLGKNKFTYRALTLALNKLSELADNTADKVKIVDEATVRGWSSFYPLKKENDKSVFREGFAF